MSMLEPRQPRDWAELIEAIDRFLDAQSILGQAYTEYMANRMRVEVQTLDEPTPDRVSKLRDGDVRYLLGVRYGLHCGIMAFRAMRETAARALQRADRREEKDATRRTDR